MSNGDLLRHITLQAKLFFNFFMHNRYGDTLLRRHCVFMMNSISSRVSQSSGVRSIPSNAIAHTFVSGLAVTMDSCAPWCASQAYWCPHNISGWVCIQGASVAGPCEVTKGRVKARSLVGAVIGYSRQKVIQCQRLQPSWRQWIQKMMFSLHLVDQIRC